MSSVTEAFDQRSNLYSIFNISLGIFSKRSFKLIVTENTRAELHPTTPCAINALVSTSASMDYGGKETLKVISVR